MKLLREIVRREGVMMDGKTSHRQAVRGIILNGRKLLMIFSAVNGDYKFPGGGIDANETHEQALGRELREECGAVLLQIMGEFGKVVELDRSVEKEFDTFCMTSYYYLCQVAQGQYELHLDAYEKALGFEPVWVDIEVAIDTNRAVMVANPEHVEPWTRRDTFILEMVYEQFNHQWTDPHSV